MRRSNPNPCFDSQEPDCCSQLFGLISSFFKPAQQAYEPIPEIKVPMDNVEVPVKKRTKSVSFHDREKVVLVPSRPEYFKCGLHSELWSSQDELLKYKQSALQDFKSGIIKKENGVFTYHYDEEPSISQKTNSL